MARLPVHQLSTQANPLDLGDAKVYHLADWGKLGHEGRIKVIRQIAMMRGRDPRVAQLAVKIIKKSGAKPREYKEQAAALLAWIQNPKNVYYVNEPGERLQDPIYTINHGHGDCFAENTLVLRQDMELVKIQDVKIGDKIWGKNKWSEVTNRWDKGELAVDHILLNNGSKLRLTDDHKVYVWACCGPAEKGHGPDCSMTPSGWKQCIARYGKKEVRIPVKELRPGMSLVQPEKILRADTSQEVDADLSWLTAAYIAEGWHEKSRVSFSGHDNNWKVATKHRVKRIADARGWNTRWHEKYIAVNNAELAAILETVGTSAIEKHIPSGLLREGDINEVDEGLRLDASKNTKGEGWTFGTISPMLATQYRVLQRMLGRSTSIKLVTEHGGFGTNPIYRVGVRMPTAFAERRLLVSEIVRSAETVPCFDIATDDHYVYLPEGDVTVSNCDDQVLLLCTLFESVGLPWRIVLSGATPSGKVRHIEGQKLQPNVNWSHIYCMVGVPPFNPTKWYFCETTLGIVPLGWDIVAGDSRYLPELGGKPGEIPQIMAAPAYGNATTYSSSSVGGSIGASVAEAMDEQGGIKWRQVGQAIMTGVAVAVTTQLVLDWVRGQGRWAKE